ncbi:MAG: redoxin domain-containing protein [Bdellovibrionota bacterium]
MMTLGKSIRGALVASSLYAFSAVSGAIVFSSLAWAAPSKAPEFSVDTLSGKHISSAELRGKVVVLEWFNSGCPFVKHFYDSSEMQQLQKSYTAKGVEWITVNSTGPHHRDYHDPAATKTLMGEMGIAATDYVIDADGTLGRLFQAKSTPTVVVLDREGNIAYRGAVDNNPDADESTPLKRYLQPALDEVLSGKPVSMPETDAYGCSIKYE